jgi:hypothetical protein
MRITLVKTVQNQCEHIIGRQKLLRTTKRPAFQHASMRITLVKTVQNQCAHIIGRVVTIAEIRHFLDPKPSDSPHSQILRKKEDGPSARRLPLCVGHGEGISWGKPYPRTEERLRRTPELVTRWSSTQHCDQARPSRFSEKLVKKKSNQTSPNVSHRFTIGKQLYHILHLNLTFLHMLQFILFVLYRHGY